MSYFPTTQLTDLQNGKMVKVNPMRDLITSEPVKLLGTSFSGTAPDANFWTAAVSGAGNTVTQNGQCILTITTGAADYACNTSVQTSRYVAGASNFFRALVQYPVAGLANHRTRFGAFTTASRVPQDGFFFETEGTTFYLNYVNTNATDPPIANRVASANWTVPFTLDTGVHVYEIVYTNSKAWFYVDDILRHTLTATSAPFAATYALPISLQNISVTSTTAFVLNVRVVSIYRFGPYERVPVFKYITGSSQCKIGAGNLHCVSVCGPATGTVTLADSASAATTPAIAAIVIPALKTDPFELNYHGLHFNSGLYITNAIAAGITVIYD
jgi:hypothetical protein